MFIDFDYLPLVMFHVKHCWFFVFLNVSRETLCRNLSVSRETFGDFEVFCSWFFLFLAKNGQGVLFLFFLAHLLIFKLEFY